MLFGTEAQKQKYLPKLLSGELIGAYGLSETGSGSDALGARTRATRQADGSFVLNGEKMWITNGGFADLFVVFAKVDGEHFTAFLVERGFGVKSGKEEHKMGLHGSSTTRAHLPGREGPGRERARRGRQGPQGRVQRAELRALQAGRDVQRRRAGGDRRGGEVRRRSAGSSASRSRRSAPSNTRSARWSSRTYAIESLLYRTAGLDRRADRRDAARADRRLGGARGVRGIRRSRRRSPRSPAARRSTSSSTRTSRFTAATAT